MDLFSCIALIILNGIYWIFIHLFKKYFAYIIEFIKFNLYLLTNGNILTSLLE